MGHFVCFIEVFCFVCEYIYIYPSFLTPSGRRTTPGDYLHKHCEIVMEFSWENKMVVSRCFPSDIFLQETILSVKYRQVGHTCLGHSEHKEPEQILQSILSNALTIPPIHRPGLVLLFYRPRKDERQS